MRKVYNANSTSKLLRIAIPADFKIAKEVTSNGYQYMNSLYGIEIDSVTDYLDQAKHAISFENFDYGYDFQYSEIELPVIIESGYIYGDTYPIKITSDSEFMDGTPTRMVHNSGLNIDISGYIINNDSSINGVEYMRTGQTGSGVLYINTSTSSTDAVISGTYPSYKLPLTDLIEPEYDILSGFNAGIEIQDYDKQRSLELLQPQGFSTLTRMYPLIKYLYLPQKGIKNASPGRYVVDFYKPENYYWDEYNNTYKPVIPTKNSYKDNGEDVYFRVALNNPNGAGVFDTEYLELEHAPISGTLKLFDIDSVNDKGKAIEIAMSGTQLYKYTTESQSYTYIGYMEEVPYEAGLNTSGIIADPYKVTSWDYVHEDDGLVDFIWEEDPSKPITNKIKIVNPQSRYFVEYTYAIDKQQHCITTMNCNRYVRYDSTDYIYSSTDINDNAVILDYNLSNPANGLKRAVTFNGFDVRPGTRIQELQLIAQLQKDNITNKSASVNITDEILPGSIKTVVPNIENYEHVFFKHTYNDQVLLPSGVTPPAAFAGNMLAQHLHVDSGGLYSDEFYEFYDPNLVENRFLRTRFKYNSTTDSSFNIMTSITSDFSWRVKIVNGFLIIEDTISTFTTNERVTDTDRILEIIVIANGVYNDTFNTMRFSVLVSTDNSFFKSYSIYENQYTQFIEFGADKSTMLNGVNVDLDFISIYDEGNLDDRNLL